MNIHRRSILEALPAALVLSLPTAVAASLRSQDIEEFQRYTNRAEEAVRRRAVNGAMTGFPASVPATEEPHIFSRAKQNPLDIGSAYIHDWSGVAHFPGASAAALLRVLQDYDRHKEYYAPEVMDSRHLGQQDGVLLSYLRLRKKKVLTVILDSEYRNRFVELGRDAGYSLSNTVSVREVENAGAPGERVLPDGAGHGFLWRLNAYWMWQRTASGLWVECQAISLSRDVPAGLAWMVAPIIRSLPRESLAETLANTRKAVAALLHG